MFKKTEESEWTRFSRALQSQPARPDEVVEPEDEDETLELSSVANAPASDDLRDEVTPVPTYARPEPAYTHAETPTYEDVADEPVPAPPPAPAPMPAPMSAPRAELADPDETVLGEGARLEGTIRSDRSVRVRGTVSGEIESRDQVTIEGTARVDARIVAERVIVIGEVSGQIECGGRVEIAPTGRVTGEVRTGTLIIQEGAFFQGQLTMVPKDGPIAEDDATSDDGAPRDELDAGSVRSPQSGESLPEEDAAWSSARAPSSSSY